MINNNQNIPQGYKNSSLGVIPQEWEVKRLGDLVEIRSGESPSLFNLASSGKYPYVKVEDMNNCEKYQTHSREYSDNEKSIIVKGSVIFPKRGAAILNNKVRIAGTNIQMDSNMMAITPDENKVLGEYLYFRVVCEQLFKIADTSTIPQINNKHIIPYKLPVPSLEEQRRIAEVLGCWDEAIERQGRMVELLTTRKRALMQRLLTPQPHWQKIKAGNIFKNTSIKGCENEELLSSTQEYGIIPRNMLETRVTMPSGEIKSFKLVEKGNFVISLRSFQGGIEYSNYKGIVSPAYTVLTPEIQIDDVFYKYYFKSIEFISRLAVAVIGIRDGKQISYDDFCFIRIPNPPLTEQKSIAEKLSTADEEIGLARRHLDLLRTQKRALMQQLLTGKKRLKYDI